MNIFVINSKEELEKVVETIFTYEEYKYLTNCPLAYKTETLPKQYPCLLILAYAGGDAYEMDFVYLTDFNRLGVGNFMENG